MTERVSLAGISHLLLEFWIGRVVECKINLPDLKKYQLIHMESKLVKEPI